MNLGLKPMVDLTMQEYGKHTRSFQDDIGDTRKANCLSPATKTYSPGVEDTKGAPVVFSLSPDWKSSGHGATLEVEVPLERSDETESLSAPEYEFRHGDLLSLRHSEAYSAPSNLQIQSHSLFAFRTSYSGAFLSTADDLRERSSVGLDISRDRPATSNQSGLGLENSTVATERGLRRQDSDASVDDLIFREWRKMRPRTSLLRDDSMASLSSLPRTESEISIDGERVQLDEAVVSNLKLDSVEDAVATTEYTVKDDHENIGNNSSSGLGKQNLAYLDYGSSSGILKPIVEQDFYMNKNNELKGLFWEQHDWNGMYMQSLGNASPSWNPTVGVSDIQNGLPGFEGNVTSASSPLQLNNSKRLGNSRQDSGSTQIQNAIVPSTTSSSSRSSIETNLFYKDGLKPATAAAAAVASAASAANKMIPRATGTSHAASSQIYSKVEHSVEMRGAHPSYFGSIESYSTYASVPFSYSWGASSDPSFLQTSMYSGNNHRRNIMSFSAPPTNAATSLTGNPSKTWSMEDIVGRIFELAKDQHGCRFLQMKLEEGNPAYIAMIFTECFDGLAELMVDPFGNYLCQKLFESCNFQQRLSILQHTCNVLAQVSMNMHGTRVVQRIIECIEGEDQISSVCTALAPFASQLMKDVNGNHVIQRCLQKISPKYNQFIFDAVVSHCVELATHRHGCCVIQRCLDYAIPAQKEQVCMEICENAFTLVQDAFGNYVVQYVLDLKNRFYIAKIIAQLAGHLFELSVQKFSSNVVEKCLQQVDPETRKHLIYELMSDRELLGRLLHDAYGNYVVQRALQLAQSPQLEQFCEIIRPHLPSLKSTPYGKRIYSKIVRRFPESSS
jgi:hypothetical protein